ncbi:hypothetical protein CDAR_274511 [Caerostris darwini]|uniref:Uncharacterized protein n=1 Tax=Caerostris darwini TaxID=1538125 RepID=A0AAV4RBJ4_9ARAC|nr:hypothetical protein CDAR_274511 [Caerostris darwini]
MTCEMEPCECSTFVFFSSATVSRERTCSAKLSKIKYFRRRSVSSGAHSPLICSSQIGGAKIKGGGCRIREEWIQFSVDLGIICFVVASEVGFK